MTLKKLLFLFLLPSFLLQSCSKREWDNPYEMKEQSEKPVADFEASPLIINEGQTVYFLDLSINNPTEWLWDFGDGGKSSERNTTHIYNLNGTYKVSLTISNAYGSDSETKLNYISVGTAPVAAFTAAFTIININKPVSFTDQSSNIVTSWLWNFGDGVTSEQKNPVHSYSSIGLYSVSLTVTNAFGSDNETKSNYISVLPTCPSTFIDSRDNNEYNAIQIGTQCWMAENLAFLPSVSPSSLGSTTQSCYYVYDYEGIIVSESKATINYQTYGVLYNWFAAMNGALSSNSVPSGIQGICPTGWHLPSDAEWTILINELGGTMVAGDKMKEAGFMHWISPNTATNSSGFSVLPGGNRHYNGYFTSIGHIAGIWSSTEDNNNWAWYRLLYNDDDYVSHASQPQSGGSSVRCIKD
ncbi:FISUMP domain-containing protein [Bacteroidota bacterium]